MKRRKIKKLALALLLVWSLSSISASFATCDHVYTTHVDPAVEVSQDHLGNLAHAHWDHDRQDTPRLTKCDMDSSSVDFEFIVNANGTGTQNMWFVGLKLNWPKEHAKAFAHPGNNIICEHICQCKQYTATTGKTKYPFTGECDLCGEKISGFKYHQYDAGNPINDGSCGLLAGCAEG